MTSEAKRAQYLRTSNRGQRPDEPEAGDGVPLGRESRGRSLVKAISWRVTALAVTASVVFVYTGEVRMAALVGLADATVKIALYYLHERAWDRTGFGRRGI